ncbi:hypothetical protein ACJJTC_007274, partial [Scirpophaga incertulas]
GITYETRYTSHKLAGMEIITSVCAIIGIAVLLILLCKCCRRSNRGQVISTQPPPPPPGTVVIAPYPQQQYVIQTHSPYAAATSTVPYPAAYPHPAPHAAPLVTAAASHAPTAPDLAALPPSYEQATGAGAHQPPTNFTQSPYNPSYPH